jgi:transcriptional regulator with XRE-family HTH domain
MRKRTPLRTVVKRRRKALGITQAALAQKVGVTKQYITMLERGKHRSPSLPTLRKLAKALGVPVTELLG